jgi:hypothetical protein
VGSVELPLAEALAGVEAKLVGGGWEGGRVHKMPLTTHSQ